MTDPFLASSLGAPVGDPRGEAIANVLRGASRPRPYSLYSPPRFPFLPVRQPTILSPSPDAQAVADILLGAHPPRLSPLAPIPPAASARPQWIYVKARFEGLLQNLQLTKDQVDDGISKLSGVADRLNRAYWGAGADAHHILIGSWRKQTRVRPPRDVDLLFVLPYEVYTRYQQRGGNKQSYLLQEIRSHLLDSYPATDIVGDRQVVTIPFTTYRVEVAPVFLCTDGSYLGCDARDGGRYTRVDPNAEFAAFDQVDRSCVGNLRKLVRALKQWQRYCNVPIKSLHIEALLKELLPTLDYGANDEFWFDWLVRNFFGYAISRARGSFVMPGTQEAVHLGDDWVSHAQTAYARAVKACDYERDNYGYLAGDEWQKIFGPMIPII